MNSKKLILNDNIMFSRLTGLDLQELLVQIENYDLDYRTNLNLPSNITFGAEIEYENVDKKIVDYFISNYKNWESKTDGSLTDGGEINSPIMKDEKQYWQELKSICKFLTRNKANTSVNAGGHIHIGAHPLTKIKYWHVFLRLYAIYEPVLFRFFYGDKISGREKINDYARPIAQDLYKEKDKIAKAKRIGSLEYILPGNRRQALNFTNINFEQVKKQLKGNTLEFRNPNATIDDVVWQNNINVASKMVLSSTQEVIDESFLDYKLNKEFKIEKNRLLYSEINLKDALEFVDLIFDNTLDKIYFLRQYLKDFQDSFGTKPANFAKKFTK